MKALKCTPRNKEEWDAILDLAGALGVGGRHPFPYNENRSLWNSCGCGPIYPLGNKSQCDKATGEAVATSEFITSIYKLAEEKGLKSDYRVWDGADYAKWSTGFSGDAKDLASKWTGYTTFGTFGEPCYYTRDRLRDIQISNLEKRVKELEAQVWENGCKISHAKRDANALDGRLSARLEKLEKVVSEEMGKDRVAQKIDDITWAGMYMRIRDAMGFVGSMHMDATTRMTDAYFGK